MTDPEISVEELTLDQKVAVLMHELPQPLQDFLQSPARDAVSLELSNKYQLHADQAGTFAQAFIYMLLGVYSPDEFVQELRDAHIQEDTIRGLTNDVNERVFRPLQNAERASSVPSAAPGVVPLQPKPTYVPPPAPIAPQPIPAPLPVPSAPQPTPTYTPSAPSEPQNPLIHTMAADMEEAKHPHAPAPFVSRPMYATQATQTSPARSFQTSSVPNTTASVQHLPGSMPATPVPVPVPVPPIAPAPQPAAPVWQPSVAPIAPRPVEPVAPVNPNPIIKEYGTDPYRELPQ